MKSLCVPACFKAALSFIIPCLVLNGGIISAKDTTVTIPEELLSEVKALIAAHKARKPAPQAAASAGPVAGGPGDERAAPPNIELFDFTAGERFKIKDLLTPRGVEQVRAEAVTEEPLKDLGAVQEAFRLRQSWDSVKLFQYNGDKNRWEESPSTGLASDGAEFGWSRNRLTKTDTWNAKGVAFFPIIMKANESQQFLLLPSVEFDRDSSADGTSHEINSLIARLGVDFNYVSTAPGGGASGVVYRTAVGYQTDFDFASGQWIFELQTEPVNEQEGIGVFALRPEGDVTYHESFQIPGTRRKLSIAPILTLADVSDLGSKEALEQLEENYATVGFKVGLTFEIESLKRIALLAGLKVGAEYRWWTTLGSDHQSFDYLEAHLTAPFLGSEDKLMLKAFYRRGSTPDTLEEEDMMGMALTAKF